MPFQPLEKQILVSKPGLGNESAKKPSAIQQLLEVPWLGLRSDVVLHPGPVDPDGQRSYVLEDPVRGNNFRLGYAEGELLYRLAREPDPDAAAANLYATTTLRPAPQEIAAFITMLQKEGLANLPTEEVIRREMQGHGSEIRDHEDTSHSPDTSFLQKIFQGAVFFRIPLLKPDAFLNRALPWVSWLWSRPAGWIYLFCGLTGLMLTLQEIELYFSTVSYLFTPQGAAVFFLCLALLKTGHEFAHAFAVKALGNDLHVRSMGVFFIVFWPLFYTDTTDVWKIPDRGQRIWVSAAGVLFEMAVAGIALLMWALLPDGIPRSLMFVLSGTSLISTVFVNLNPFMRFDGYYLLMDLWGIDNLRSRSFAILRHAVRRILLDWKGGVPEIHPHRRGMIVYGILALMYRIFITLSIALAAYHLYSPAFGVIVLFMEIGIFIVRPLWFEVQAVMKASKMIGSKFRVALTICGFMMLIGLLCLPMPRFTHLPCLLMLKGANRIDAPSAGQLAMPLPQQGKKIGAGELITRINSDALEHDARNAKFDLKSVKTSIEGLGGGGEQGAYRNWLLAEEDRLKAVCDKMAQAIAQLEIRAPTHGQITDVNEDLYEGAYIASGTYLFTVADADAREVKVFVHEKISPELIGQSISVSEFQPAAFGPRVAAYRYLSEFREKSDFPVMYLPNESLLDIAHGPIMSVRDARGFRPRDAHFSFTFDVKEKVPDWLPHGMPSWIWVRSESRSVMGQLFSAIWKSLTERGLF